MNKQPTWFFCELFRQNFYFFVSWPEKKFIDYCKKHFNADFSQKTIGFDGLTLMLENGKIIVWVSRSKQKFSYLTHELTHAMNMVFDSRGVLIDAKNDELQAYYLQMLVRVSTKGAQLVRHKRIGQTKSAGRPAKK